MSLALSPAAAISRTRALPLPAVVFVLALLWTLACRLPFYRFENGDDAVFVEIADLWRRGVLPYVGVFDVKPPGLFAAIGLSELVFGPTMVAIKALGILGDATTATSLFLLARRFDSPKVGVFAAALFAPLNLVVVTYDASGPLTALTSLAFLAALSDLSPLRRAALAGLAVGAAATIKQTAAFEALALLCLLVGETPRARTALVFLAAASLAPLAFLLYFAASGAAGPLIADTVLAALNRPGSDMEGVTFANGLLRFIPVQKPILPLIALCLLAALRAPALQAAAPKLALRALFAWLLAAYASLLLQHSLYFPYLAPALAPALLIAGFCADSGVKELARWPATARLALAAAATLTCALVVMGHEFLHCLKQDFPALDAAASAIRASGPRPSDTLYVVDRGAWLNNMTGLAPPTRFVFAFHAICPFVGGGADPLSENLNAHPRYMVVSDRRLGAYCERPESWARIDAALAHDYRPLAHVSGTHDSYDVYERGAAP
jgi:hypothetical protein